MLRGCLLSAIHPYAGIIQIRLEGIISAYTRRHPLIIGCKGNDIFYNSHTFMAYFYVLQVGKDGFLIKKLPVPALGTDSFCL